ncbi:MAG: CPBP family intramembrane metalloprotease [Trueperaceae bacterium]|nr:CPBP family intramembrane metalloprotease [Trueperaceae bacterium]
MMPSQHRLSTSVLLHLYPGVVILGLYLLLVPLTNRIGYPPLLALMIAALLTLFVLELGHLLRKGYKQNSRWSLEGVILYQQKTRPLMFIAITLATVAVAFILFGLTQVIDMRLLERFFSWLPDWYIYTDLAAFKAYPKRVLIITFAIRLVLDGLVFPTIEELYFRGYLQPRLSRFGAHAPLLSHGLFTLYHVWQPWNYPTIFLAVLPLAYAVWWKRDYHLGIAIHCALNVLGGTLTLLAVLA